MKDRAFHPLKVTAIRPAGAAGTRLTFDVPDELRPVFHGLSGQHIAVRATLAGVEVRRTYSLISPAGQYPLEIAVRLHDQGLMCRHLGNELRVGDRVEVMPPAGSLHSRLDGSVSRSYLGLAAGCGITPVLAVLTDKLLHEPLSRATLVFGNRSTSRMMCLEEVMTLKDRFLERFSVHFLMSREPQQLARFNARLDAHWLQEFLDAPSNRETCDEVFVCVPGVEDGTLRNILLRAGIADDCIHAESFNASAARQPVRVSEPEGATDEVQVGVLMDGRRRSFVMDDSGATLLEAALDAGLDLPYSCCGGVCSTCRARVVEGKVEMAQNHALEDWEIEAGFVLVCQSRPITSSVVLDYDSI